MTLPLTIEEILYHCLINERENFQSNSKLPKINPFDWIGNARVEQSTFLKFIQDSESLNSELNIFINSSNTSLSYC